MPSATCLTQLFQPLHCVCQLRLEPCALSLPASIPSTPPCLHPRYLWCLAPWDRTQHGTLQGQAALRHRLCFVPTSNFRTAGRSPPHVPVLMKVTRPHEKVSDLSDYCQLGADWRQQQQQCCQTLARRSPALCADSEPADRRRINMAPRTARAKTRRAAGSGTMCEGAPQAWPSVLPTDVLQAVLSHLAQSER